jgi:ankyrin repeat protein
MAQARRLAGWFMAPGVLKALALFAILAVTISCLTKLKAQQLAARRFQPIRLEWTHGTSDPQLQDAISMDDGPRAASLLPGIPKSKMRENIVERLSYDKDCRVLDAFLSSGWDPDGPGHKGHPLFAAILYAQTKAMEVLLSHGAKANVFDDRHRSSMVWACVNFRYGPKMIDMLAKHGAPLDQVDSLIPAFGRRQGFAMVKVRPLTIAVMRGNRSALRELLRLGVSAKPREEEQLPPLIAAVGSDYPEQMTALLLEAGSPPDQLGKSVLRVAPRKGVLVTASALFFNAARDQWKAVDVLLKHGANPRLKGSNGKTCLEVATGESLKHIKAALAMK